MLLAHCQGPPGFRESDREVVGRGDRVELVTGARPLYTLVHPSRGLFLGAMSRHWVL